MKIQRLTFSFAEELKEMIVARLCEPGQKKSLFPVKRKQIDAIEMAEFSFEETNSSSSSIQHEQEEEGDPSKIPPKASRQEERVQKIISDWKLIELDEGKPIWHRGREMSSSVFLFLIFILEKCFYTYSPFFSLFDTGNRPKILRS